MSIAVLALLASLASQAEAPAATKEEPAAQPAAEPAAQPAAPPKQKLLVLDVKAADLTTEQAASLTDVVATRAARFTQAEVIASTDLRELLNLQAEKIEMGCDDTDSCLAELAGALNAEWVLATRAGKIGSRYVVTVQLYDAKQGAVAGRDTVEAYGLDELPTKMSEMVDAVLTRALGAAEDAPVAATSDVEATPGENAADAPAIAPLNLGLQIGGGAAVVAGLVVGGLGLVPYALYSQKKGDLGRRTRAFDGSQDQLDAAAVAYQDALGYRDAYNNVGRFAFIGGVVLVLGGAAALAAGFLLPPLDELTGGT